MNCQIKPGKCLQSWVLISVCLETMVVQEYHKVCARRDPWMLTHPQKEHSTQICQDLLNHYEAEGDCFPDCITSSNEMWYHHWVRVKMAVCGVVTWTHHQRKSSSINSQCVKWCTLSAAQNVFLMWQKWDLGAWSLLMRCHHWKTDLWNLRHRELPSTSGGYS